MAGFKTIDVEELKGLRDVVLIDVRTEAEVARGMISGALHIPLHALPLKAAELDSGSRIVVYCQSGGRSAQACGFLSMKGFSDVSNLQGGILAWAGSGNALA